MNLLSRRRWGRDGRVGYYSRKPRRSEIESSFVAGSPFLPVLGLRLRPELHPGAALLFEPEPVLSPRTGPERSWIAEGRLAGEHSRSDTRLHSGRGADEQISS